MEKAGWCLRNLRGREVASASNMLLQNNYEEGEESKSESRGSRVSTLCATVLPITGNS